MFIRFFGIFEILVFFFIISFKLFMLDLWLLGGEKVWLDIVSKVEKRRVNDVVKFVYGYCLIIRFLGLFMC